jgi:hypothetical protein
MAERVGGEMVVCRVFEKTIGKYGTLFWAPNISRARDKMVKIGFYPVKEQKQFRTLPSVR